MSETETRATPPLAEFLDAFAEDDNEWWRLQGGDHLNLFEELLDERDAARAEVAALRSRILAVEALHTGAHWCTDQDGRSDFSDPDPAVRQNYPCPTLSALASVGSSGEEESGEACIRGDGSRCVSDPDACAEAGVCWPGKREAESGENRDPADYGPSDDRDADPEETICRTCGHVAVEHTGGRYSMYGTCPAPVSSGGQADGSAVDAILTEHFGHTVYEATGDQPEECHDECPACLAGEQITALLAARPVLSREAVEGVLAEVREERARQDAKWGEQNHDPAVWLAILTEEVGEFAEAILFDHSGGDERNHTHSDSMRTEAVQIAAVAVQIVEYLDRHLADVLTAGGEQA